MDVKFGDLFDPNQPRSNRELIEHRLEICNNCEFINKRLMKCKQCGCELVDYTTVAYCPLCRIKRTMKTVEIDPSTGEWEGVKHD